jgi:hypothetical protein
MIQWYIFSDLEREMQVEDFSQGMSSSDSGVPDFKKILIEQILLIPMPRITNGINLEAPSPAPHWVQRKCLTSHTVIAGSSFCWAGHSCTSEPVVGVSSASVLLFLQACSPPPVPREAKGIGTAGP